jgi:hypothetical protein
MGAVGRQGCLEEGVVELFFDVALDQAKFVVG